MDDAAGVIEDLKSQISLLKVENEAVKAEKRCGRRWSWFTLGAGIVVGMACQISWVFGSFAVFLQLIQIFLLSGPPRRPAAAPTPAR